MVTKNSFASDFMTSATRGGSFAARRPALLESGGGPQAASITSTTTIGHLSREEHSIVSALRCR